MRTTGLLIIITHCCFSVFAFAGQSFSSEEVLSDLATLRDSLQSTHYNAFAYTSEERFHATYEALRKEVNQESYNLLETVSLYQKLVSSLNNGHTEIDYPAASYLEYAGSGGTVFPLELAFENGKALVRKNLSSDESIVPGTELLSVNGTGITEILDEIYPHISAERIYFKNAKLELLTFPRYYWQVFGEQEAFVVVLASGASTREITVQSVAAMEGYEHQREEIILRTREIKFLGNVAYLKPGNFSGDKAEYESFIDDAFKQINNAQSEHLLIDLKNNGGGDDAFSDYLVSFIADKPFKWNASFSLKTSALLKEDTAKNRDLSNPYWQAVLDHPNGAIYDYDFEPYEPQPEDRRFMGSVYVLINRQSHSQAAVTAAQIQDYNWGIIVGEETGDYPSLYASQFQFKLPVTQIVVKISKGRIVRVSGSEKQEGVIPDIVIRDHLLDEKDEILDGILERLSNQIRKP